MSETIINGQKFIQIEQLDVIFASSSITEAAASEASAPGRKDKAMSEQIELIDKSEYDAARKLGLDNWRKRKSPLAPAQVVSGDKECNCFDPDAKNECPVHSIKHVIVKPGTPAKRAEPDYDQTFSDENGRYSIGCECDHCLRTKNGINAVAAAARADLMAELLEGAEAVSDCEIFEKSNEFAVTYNAGLAIAALIRDREVAPAVAKCFAQAKEIERLKDANAELHRQLELAQETIRVCQMKIARTESGNDDGSCPVCGCANQFPVGSASAL